jgi:hypothetical protein
MTKPNVVHKLVNVRQVHCGGAAFEIEGFQEEFVMTTELDVICEVSFTCPLRRTPLCLTTVFHK